MSCLIVYKSGGVVQYIASMEREADELMQMVRDIMTMDDDYFCCLERPSFVSEITIEDYWRLKKHFEA